MKLRVLSPPSWQLARAITKWKTKLKIPLARPDEKYDKLILVGNGVQDAIAYLILTHKLDGTQVLGITKTEKTRLGTISHIPTIIRQLKIEKIVFSIDQEDQELDDLKTQLENTMRRKYGINFNLEEEQNRLYIYNCSHLNRQFELIVTINGLDIPSYTKHTIEDHLLLLFKELSNNDEKLTRAVSNARGNPKEAWRLLEKHHENVYLNLLDIEDEKLQKIFPQQITSIKRLKPS